MSAATALKRVAVIDDDFAQAETTSLQLEEAGFEPWIVRAATPFQHPQELLREIVNNQVMGAICDHRLTPNGFSTFNGAEFSATLYDSGYPAVLTTQYVDMDVDVSIRKWRHKIPVLLSRDLTNSESIRLGLIESAKELRGEIAPNRKPRKALIRVTDRRDDAEGAVLDVIIPSWNPLRAVRFPLSLVPADLQPSVRKGSRLFAQVNIGADDQEDLFFEDFEAASEPDATNGIA